MIDAKMPDIVPAAMKLQICDQPSIASTGLSTSYVPNLSAPSTPYPNTVGPRPFSRNGIPSFSMMHWYAFVIEPSYFSGAVCIRVLITSIGVATPCEIAALSPPARKGAGICVASMMPTIPSPRSDHLLANLPSFSLYFAASEIPTDSTDKIATRLPSSLRRALLLSASDISSAKMSPAGVASASTIASAPAPAPAAPTTPAALLTSACPEPDEASRSSALSMAIARPPVALRLRTCSIPQPT
eukprot:CAMPEP_0119467592 /NCGR_PEP_ID=MMETSP1344-20130328/1711_1 /TAXON_ID=236787 /ORGANISM="Florenciella parvula, Strain CCMP2471" /LENGTH=242 /DNA_ID=CAMNT_0007499971 /DNA_START=682 /DNA_END=1407 /DNA_ORIENTATION=-